MRRLLVSIVGLMLALTLGMSTIAHAAEPIVCVELPVGDGLSHFDGESDEVPADAGKAAPHHGTCHGHHVAVDDSAAATAPDFHPTSRFSAVREADQPSALPGADLRPPIA